MQYPEGHDGILWPQSTITLFVLELARTSSQDGGISKHGSPPCKTASQLQLKYRTTITQNGQKSR